MDWIGFFNDNSIPWVSSGPNTARGEVSIKCVWCGEDDPSQHLGVSLTSENWGCLRDPSHRGHSSTFLVGALLGCSQHQAKLVVGQYSKSDPDQIDTSDIPEVGEEWFKKAELVLPDGPEQLPALRPIAPLGSSARFWHYLKTRGFDDPPAVIEDYSLACCLTGRFKDRLIVPFYQRGEMVAWTGRALGNPKHAARYLSSKRVKETIFNQDGLMRGGKVLFVTEGPFDALKMDFYGKAMGARATCALGVSLSIEQIVLLNSRRRRFERTVILFDQDAIGPAYQAMDWLTDKNVSVGQLPEGVKDPGDMNADQVIATIRPWAA
jgi:hypothetical protein